MKSFYTLLLISQELDRKVKVASPKWAKAVLKTFEMAQKYLQ